ncbi:MAG: formyltransferase family protein [Planctomycetota bacterium]|nr:formyltransferase family protein [Planctomycetota bacterium]
MKVLFLLSDYVLHNSLLTQYADARPCDELAVVKIPLVLKGKGRRGTAERILPQLSRRFAMGKLLEYMGLLTITALPKVLARGAIFRRLRATCKRQGIPFQRSENVMAPESLEFVRAFAPDVIVSLCHQILKEPLISMAPLGIVNVHPGLLPDFRGIQPYFWELSEGSARAGATLHLIEDEGVDTGGVLGHTSFPTTPGMSVQLNYYLTIQCAARLLPACLEALQNGELTPEVQTEGQGAYFRWPDSEAFARLRAAGHPLISYRQLVGILNGRYDDHRADDEGLMRQV